METATALDTRPADPQVIIDQIGRMTVMAISGGRAEVVMSETEFPYRDGLRLPVSNGYRVEIRLMANDTYNVRRIFRRGSKEWVKAEWTEVYCDQVSDVAYEASCFRNV